MRRSFDCSIDLHKERKVRHIINNIYVNYRTGMEPTLDLKGTQSQKNLGRDQLAKNTLNNFIFLH
jgi:hypothetical protein